MRTLLFIAIVSSLIKAQIGNFSSTQTITDTTFSKVISEDSLKFNFSVTMDVFNQDDPLDTTYASSIYNVNVYSPINKKHIQTIVDTLYYPRIYWRNLSFYDMNFDKYLDLVFVTDVTMHGDEIYSVWLYDTKTNSFINEPAYSDLCCNMDFDTTKSEILIEYVNYSITEMQSRTYKIINNKPELFFMQTTEIFKKEGNCYRHIQQFQLINNELTLIDDNIEEALEDECNNL